MNANPRKKKFTSTLRKQNRKFVQSDKVQTDLLLNQDQDLKALWAEEMKLLRSQTYVNLAAACDALISAVVQRFYPGTNNLELRNTLKLYIENDPDLLEQINRILIKKL